MPSSLEKWLEWVPQLLAGLGSKEARVFHAILQTIGRVHPQALYFPIRNVYLTGKIFILFPMNFIARIVI